MWLAKKRLVAMINGGTSQRRESQDSSPAAKRILGYCVHLFTATGVVFAFLAAAEVCSATPEPRLVFLYLAIQVIIDALDGPAARAVNIKYSAPAIDGRKLDDIIDYLTYTFVPLLLIWRMGWVPEPGLLWIAPAIVASLFGFCNVGAKHEEEGYFLGFPSYWNIVAFYLGLWYPLVGPWPGAILIAIFTIATVLPLKFIYPNLAPPPWKRVTIIGAILWTLAFAWMLWNYESVPPWFMLLSLLYPIGYLALSLYVSVKPQTIGPAA